jgi:hypothetical protein
MLWVDSSTNPYQLRVYNSGETQFDVLSGFASGTRMLFQQQAAPPGWTKVTSGVDNMALRVTTGNPSIVDSNQAFSTVFTNQTPSGSVAPTSLTINQMPVHKHGVNDPGHTHSCSVNDPGHKHRVSAARAEGDTEAGNGDDEARNKNIDTDTKKTGISVSANSASSRITTQNNGAGASHTHGFTGTALNLAINYVDVIIAQKD